MIQPHSLYLASQSPRRAQLLTEMGVTFTVIQNLLEHETLEASDGNITQQIEQLCLRKAIASSEGFSNWILTADTCVLFKQRCIGKPNSIDQAIDTLSQLSGQSHQVITSMCLYHPDTKDSHLISDSATVTFHTISNDNISQYVHQHLPLDKAGSYGIQEIPASFLKSLSGEKSTVMGLSKNKLKIIIKQVYT